MVRKSVAKDQVQFPILMKLSSLKDKLTAREVEFARSLVTNFNKYGRLSDKQMFFVQKMITQAEAPAPTPTATVSVAAINALFDKAAEKLKRIKVTLKDAADQKVVFKRAGELSKYAGQIMISDGGPFGQAQFFGRIDTNGNFIATPRATESVKALVLEFATDPEDTAGKYGRLTGGCCFCSKGLDDKRSLEVGYGPVCAKNFGLRWGK